MSRDLLCRGEHPHKSSDQALTETKIDCGSLYVRAFVRVSERREKRETERTR